MVEDEKGEDLRLVEYFEFNVDKESGDTNVTRKGLGGDTLLDMVTDNFSEQIRELRDINARLTNANLEKDMEIQQLKVKLSSLTGQNAQDTVTGAKIVELAKAKRELSAKYESEVAKVKKLQNDKAELERKLMYSECSVVDIVARDKELNSSRRVLSSKPAMEKKPEPSQSDTDVRLLSHKLHSAVEKTSLAAHENACLRQQLQKVHKLLEREVGPGVDVAALLKEETPGYRGRDQLIQLLKSKLDTSRKEMEALKLFDRETTDHGPSASNLSLRTPSSWKSIGKPEPNEYNQKYKEQLAHVDQKRRADIATLAEEHEKLQKAYCDLKAKTAADKDRMDYLSKENTRLCQFNRHVLETCKKDAELIQYFQKTIVELREAFSKTAGSSSHPLTPLPESHDSQILKVPSLSIRSSTSLSGSSRRSVASRSSRSVNHVVSKKIAQMEQEIANLKQLNSMTFDELGSESGPEKPPGLRSSGSVQSTVSTVSQTFKSPVPTKSSSSSVATLSKNRQKNGEQLSESFPEYTLYTFLREILTKNHGSRSLETEMRELEELRMEHSRTKESAEMLQLKLSHLQLATEAKQPALCVPYAELQVSGWGEIGRFRRFGWIIK
ncbi:hypothetical protein RvY_00528 [Ramazzottius varieornatus]|uniref:Uncharacterized protein n=1 Tax=Ramazzottius varieornatus TaxID=947166 RepID=A0A1D1UNH2_RAMVA|nr:hypothetical protein RvY_00528 [Ramazzottius varieornatus]